MGKHLKSNLSPTCRELGVLLRINKKQATNIVKKRERLKKCLIK
jgi:hypothetical protein